MSVGARVLEALEHYERGNPEGALVAACVALDATARKEYSTKATVGERYKAFVHENLWVIGWVGFRGVIAQQIRLKALHPKVDVGPDGMCSIEDVIYHVIRCGLIHEASVNEYVAFSDEVIMGYDGPRYVFDSHLPVGLAAAAVLSPVNRDERTGDGAWIRLGSRSFLVNELWGRRKDVIAMLSEDAHGASS